MIRTIKILKKKYVKFDKLSSKQIEEREQEWFERFVPDEKQARAIECYCFPRDGYSGYLWHVFSYELLPYLKMGDARNAFKDVDRHEAILLSNWDGTGFIIHDASLLSDEDIDEMEDVIITDIDYHWTYIKTHESNLGPYFYPINQ